jgi:CheY-like chemotaxis protein
VPGSLVHFLLIEDNPGDVRLAQETLREAKFQNTMDVVGDGEEALAYLRQEDKYSNCGTPDIILLDMNLPRMDGFELVEELRGDPKLNAIPIVILAATRFDEQLLRRYNIPTECFILKPLTVEHLLEAVRCFPHIGISIVRIATA